MELSAGKTLTYSVNAVAQFGQKTAVGNALVALPTMVVHAVEMFNHTLKEAIIEDWEFH